ncbi:glycoside hydrolase family 3 N-terminal domain-containing protein [Microbacter sp. GSS18]|nr:glycoside hydrolase family 3 N-terminal domain-containing protein [Microbacter sp. GSS18]
MNHETSQSDHEADRGQPGAIDALIATLDLETKLAQLVGLWAGARADDGVAPMQDRMLESARRFEEASGRGLGQLTRHWGTVPLGVADGLAALRAQQSDLSERIGIRAVVHEECLTGVLAWGATTYPTPLAWGAAFDPDLVEEMARRIGADLRALGVHQGLAPVVDVVRDARWGRVEECISEDPLVVGLIGAAYVRGLEAEGRVATLKHFAGYSGSRGGRNHAPVSVGLRELADVYLPPFERALAAGARSVMNSYADLDGVPAAASAELLTGVLRDGWGFEGTVVADYFAVTFLETMHAVAGSAGEAAAIALNAGIDVELPTGSAYLAPLADAVRRGDVDERVVDRALRRVLSQKSELGLIGPAPGEEGDLEVDLDAPGNRALARGVAQESVILLANDGVLPLDDARVGRLAVIGPNADRFGAVFGCYSFVKHVLSRHPGVDARVEAPTTAQALAALWPHDVVTEAGCEVTGEDRSGFAAAARAAASADVAVLVLGDESGMFGAGTSGEGCDRQDLALPGVQEELLTSVVDTGTPVVLVLITGRPHALGAVVERCAAVVQAFLPGQEGGRAIADVLTGRVNPSGRLPVQVPYPDGPQPAGYLHPRLGGASEVSSADPSPRYPFGFGLSYTSFDHGTPSVETAQVPVDGTIALELTVRNTGSRRGADVLQLYATDEVAQVVRPVRQLVAFRRLELEPGEEQAWRVEIPAAALAFTGLAGTRIVEPGRVTLTRASHADDPGDAVAIDLVGGVRAVGGVADEPRWRRIDRVADASG